MCEAIVYIRKGDKEETLLEEVEILRPEGDQFYLANIHGEEKRVKARLVTIDFVEHKAVLAED